MKCIHDREIEEKKQLGIIIYTHKDDNSKCKLMNTTVNLKEICYNIDFKRCNDIRFEFAFVNSDKFKDKLVSLLKTKKEAELIITMKKYKVHIRILYEFLYKIFGDILIKNIEELKLFKISCNIDNDKFIIENTNNMILINRDNNIINKMRKQLKEKDYYFRKGLRNIGK